MQNNGKYSLKGETSSFLPLSRASGTILEVDQYQALNKEATTRPTSDIADFWLSMNTSQALHIFGGLLFLWMNVLGVSMCKPQSADVENLGRRDTIQ